MAKSHRPDSRERGVRLGMVWGVVAGVGLGLVYGALAKTADFSIGPIPTGVVASALGALLGAAGGAVAGLAGRDLSTPRAGLGFALGFLFFALGRLADDTGQAIDKALDLVIGGGFWGVIAASAAALTAPPVAPASNPESAAAQRSGE